MFPLTLLFINPFFHILIFIIIQVWARKYDLRLRDFLYLNRIKVSIVLFSLLIVVLLTTMNLINYLYIRIIIEPVEVKKLSSSTIWALFIACIISPIVEELFFRGVLYNFYKKKGILVAVILSSILFALIHYNFYRIVMIFIIGVFLALSYEITQCFWIPMLIHSGINLVSGPITEVVKRFFCTGCMKIMYGFSGLSFCSYSLYYLWWLC